MITFARNSHIAGLVDQDPYQYFKKAEAYWNECADEVHHASKTLDSLFRGVKATTGSTRNDPPLGEVNIVVHGSQFLIFIERDNTSALREWDFRFQGSEEISKLVQEQALGGPFEAAPGPNRLDSNSAIVIRGCNIGHNVAMLAQLHALFGRRAKIYASLHTMAYGEWNPGKVPNEFFRKSFFRTVKQLQQPQDSSDEKRAVETSAGLAENQLNDSSFTHEAWDMGLFFWIDPNPKLAPAETPAKPDRDLTDAEFVERHKQTLRTGKPSAYGFHVWPLRDSNSRKPIDDFEWSVDRTTVRGERHLRSHLWISKYWQTWYDSPGNLTIPNPLNSQHFRCYSPSP